MRHSIIQTILCLASTLFMFNLQAQDIVQHKRAKHTTTTNMLTNSTTQENQPTCTHVTMHLISNTGLVIHQFPLQENSRIIDKVIARLPEGIYFLVTGMTTEKIFIQ